MSVSLISSGTDVCFTMLHGLALCSPGWTHNLLIAAQTSIIGVYLRVSFAVMKKPKQLGEEIIYLILQLVSHYEGTSGQELRQNRNWYRDHGGMVITGLLSLLFYNTQYYQPRSDIVHSQLGLPNPENEQVSQEAIWYRYFPNWGFLF